MRGASNGGAVWLLLSRHITDIEDFRNNKEYITLLVYKNDGQRVYYPYDPPPYIDGVRINSPHYLAKVLCNYLYLSSIFQGGAKCSPSP